MALEGRISIAGRAEISAIYFALLKCGYDFYALGREAGLAVRIGEFRGRDDFGIPFFRGVRGRTCEVYPYWPRAAALEAATFFLDAGGTRFGDFDGYRADIMSAGNLSDEERDEAFWDWVKDFPGALGRVLAREDFRDYWEWERGWIAGQNARFAGALRRLSGILDACARGCASPVRTISVVLNPIKCAYSADYHLVGETLIFTSGAFEIKSVAHEFLHHVVHPLMEARRGTVEGHGAYPGIDPSYDRAGKLNAFEEYAVRRLTDEVVAGTFPPDIEAYLDGITRDLPARP